MLERSQVQEIAKRFLDEIAFTMVEEQKLFKFMRTWNSGQENMKPLLAFYIVVVD